MVAPAEGIALIITSEDLQGVKMVPLKPFTVILVGAGGTIPVMVIITFAVSHKVGVPLSQIW
jgi:hypothetical protein